MKQMRGQIGLGAIPIWGYLLIGLVMAGFLYTVYAGAAGLAGEQFSNATLSAVGGNTTSTGYLLSRGGLTGMLAANGQVNNIFLMAAIGVLLAAVFSIFTVFGGNRQ